MLGGKKRLCALHCICVCVSRGGRKFLLPTKPLYLLSLPPENIYSIYVEQKQPQKRHSLIISYSVCATDVIFSFPGQLSFPLTPQSHVSCSHRVTAGSFTSLGHKHMQNHSLFSPFLSHLSESLRIYPLQFILSTII